MSKIKNFLKRVLPASKANLNAVSEKIDGYKRRLSNQTESLRKMVDQLSQTQEITAFALREQLQTIVEAMDQRNESRHSELLEAIRAVGSEQEGTLEQFLRITQAISSEQEGMAKQLLQAVRVVSGEQGETIGQLLRTIQTMGNEQERLSEQILKSIQKQTDDSIVWHQNEYDELKSENAQLVRRVNNSHKALAKSIEKGNSHAIRTRRLISEVLWGEIFTSTSNQSKWLTDKAFSPGRWAVDYPFLYVLYRVLNETKPKRILELGLGQSTKMIAQYAIYDPSIVHSVVEHDAEWIGFFEKSFNFSENTRVFNLELETVMYEGSPVLTYKDFDQAANGEPFDLICIDAPFGATNTDYSRVDVLMKMPECLADSFIIMLDDCIREGEKKTGEKMKETLEQHNIAYCSNVYSGSNDMLLIASPDLKFFCSL